MRPLSLSPLCVRIALGALICLAALADSSPSRADTSAQNKNFFGMNAEYVFKLPQDQWDPHLAAIAALGVGEVRTDAFWSEVEQQAPVDGQHRYDWAVPDTIMAALARHGLRWQPILDYSTPWDGTLAGPDRWKSAPADPSDFAAFAAAFAQRYGTGGSFWSTNPSLPTLPVQTYEVWNEPNLPDFWPDVLGAADRYGELLALTAPAIRTVDPTGQVVVGGLSPTGLVEFLDEIEARHPGLIAQMNAVAFHPYGTTFDNTGARIRVLREWLDQHGSGTMPIEITETGWATPPLSESERAARMSTLVQGLARSSCGISRIIPYTWLTFESDPSNPEEWFGIANANATLKPTGVALAAAIDAVTNGTETTTSDPCAGLSEASPQREVPSQRHGSSEQGSIAPEAPSSGEQGAGSIAPEAPSSREQGNGSTVSEAPAESPVTSPISSVSIGESTVVADDSNASSGATRLAVIPSRSTVPEHVTVQARRHGDTISVQVLCSQACRPAVRVQRSADKPIGSSVSHRFATRYLAVIRLRAPKRGIVTVRVIVQTPGAAPQILIYRLRR